jgi:hypothetical protein
MIAASVRPFGDHVREGALHESRAENTTAWTRRQRRKPHDHDEEHAHRVN